MRFHPILAGSLKTTKTDKKHGSRQESHPLSDRPEIDWPCRPEYDATISFGLPFESEDSRYGKYRVKGLSELKADANGKIEPTGTGEDKAEEPPHGFSADQEARHDGQAERGPNAEDSRPFDPLRSSSVNRLNRLQDSVNRLNRLQDSANRLNRLQDSANRLNRLQDSANRLSRLQNSGILDSVLSRLHSSGILDSLNQLQDSLVRSQMEAANTFSSAFSQITQGLARSFSLPNLFESPFTGFLRPRIPRSSIRRHGVSRKRNLGG